MFLDRDFNTEAKQIQKQPVKGAKQDDCSRILSKILKTFEIVHF